MVLEIEIEAPNLLALPENFRRVQDDWPDVVREEFSRLGVDLVAALTLNTPTGATKKLALSTKAELESQPDEIKLNLIQDAQAASPSGGAIFYRPYASRGRKAGRQPPVFPLARWALAKLPDVTSAVEARSAGYALAKSIAKKGTPGNDYIINTLIQENSRIVEASEAIGDKLTLIITDF